MIKTPTLAGFLGPTRRPQRGQVMVLFAVCLLVIMGMAAIAVDGGYGLVQQRRAQNAADFGAVASAKILAGLCAGGAAPANTDIYQEIQFVVDQNAPAVGSSWVGHYLDGNGTDLGSLVTNVPNTYPPVSACGVSVDTNPHWTPYIAGIMGSNGLQTVATAKALNNPSKGNGIGIVALDKVDPHQVLGGGAGSFDVYGTIFANSSVPYHPWDKTLPRCTPHAPANGKFGGCASPAYTDVVDAKEGSTLTLHGDMDTVSGNFPLDWCFGQTGGWTSPSNGGPPNDPPSPRPPAKHLPDPYNTASCGGAPTSLQYDQIFNNNAQILDPLLVKGGPDDPFGAGNNQALCPGEVTPPQRTPDLTVPGTVHLSPGEYRAPVIIAGRNIVFDDCAATHYPGVFRFEQGLQLMPSRTQSVSGTNVMIATGAPVAIPGNVPGSIVKGTFVQTITNGLPEPANGAPCYPLAVTNAFGKPEAEALGSNLCGGTSGLSQGPYYGVTTYYQGCTPHCTVNGGAVDPTTIGTGTNFSAILGGQGTITISAPASGVYRGIALFQNRAIPANFGFDAQPDDSATVTLNGLVYNGSERCYGFPLDRAGNCTTDKNKPTVNPMDWWDVGIPFRPGGVMQAGLGTGTGWNNHESTGSVTVLGPCVVGDFNTDGGTTIVIDGRQNTYALPGVLGSGNPPITG